VPSMMIHLLAAHKLDIEPDALFCIGTVAPDAVKTREAKDKTHFRILCNREEALVNLARNTSGCDSYGEGVLLHLYLDWLWDDQAYHVYAKQHKEDGWFLAYRHEISKAGSYIFHNYGWSKKAFGKMLACPVELYGKTPGASEAEVAEMIRRNYFWHSDNDIGPSECFSPDFVEDFADRAADEYRVWREKIKDSSIFNNMGA
jgi:hypothetical protein